MNALEKFRQFKNSSIGLMALAMSSTLICIVSYKYFIKPKLDRNRRLEAEAMADYIFEKEQKIMKNIVGD